MRNLERTALEALGEQNPEKRTEESFDLREIEDAHTTCVEVRFARWKESDVARSVRFRHM
jgi:hypothetical protein